MSYWVGTSRVDITPNAMGVAMLGWGDPFHRVKGVATPLYVRAIAINDQERKNKIVMLTFDLCFVSEALRLRVQKESGLRDDELILSATHTHSAPGAFSLYPIYAAPSDGYVESVLNTYVEGALRAIDQAQRRLREAEVRIACGEFPLSTPVAFNRAVHAYNRNPEVKRKLSRFQRNLGVDREMILLRIDSIDGQPLAVINWFSVHGTSVHRHRYKIHSDNKGVAAAEMEQRLFNQQAFEGVVVFAQGAAGDVSPNFRRYFPLLEKRGVSRDDEKSCNTNARFQVDLAMKLFEKAKAAPPIVGPIDGIFEYVDMSRVDINPRHARNRPGLCTGPAEIGISALYGTAEGRGAPRLLIRVATFAIRTAQLYNYCVDRLLGRHRGWPFDIDVVQGNKIRVIESGRGVIFETSRIGKLIFPGFLNPILATLKRWGSLGALKRVTFTPQILPLQLVRLGSLAFVVVPAEFTTIAGKRLVKLLSEKLAHLGVERVILYGYSNAYAGYVVTPEEYPLQGYEAASTHFGRWTLPAYLTKFEDLCERWLKGEKPVALRPKPLDEFYLKHARHLEIP